MTTILALARAAPFNLSDADKRRLDKLAPLFGIQLETMSDRRLRIGIAPREGRSPYVELPEATGYCRLLMELSSKASRWLFFHQGEHCGQTLLGLSDAKIERIAELYAQWVLHGSPP